jgi:hypothetical protein
VSALPNAAVKKNQDSNGRWVHTTSSSWFRIKDNPFFPEISAEPRQIILFNFFNGCPAL